MLIFLPIILFCYAHGSAYYSTTAAYYANLVSHYVREELMIIMHVLNNNIRASFLS